MYEFNIEIATIPIKIISKHKYLYELCYNYLTEKNPFFSVSLSNEDILREIAILEKSGKQALDEMYLESTAVYRKICKELIKYDAFMIHSAAIKLDKTAVAFIGKSGAGKTTQSMFWVKELGAEYINGDKPIIRLINGKFYVFGTPWSGKERLNNNISAELKSLVLVQKSDSNIIERLSPFVALPIVLNQINFWNDEQSVSRIMDMVDILLSNVSVFKLYCKKEPASAHLAYNTIMNNEENK